MKPTEIIKLETKILTAQSPEDLTTLINKYYQRVGQTAAEHRVYKVYVVDIKFTESVVGLHRKYSVCITLSQEGIPDEN